MNGSNNMSQGLGSRDSPCSATVRCPPRSKQATSEAFLKQDLEKERQVDSMWWNHIHLTIYVTNTETELIICLNNKELPV